jgi:hypothetical protein
MHEQKRSNLNGEFWFVLVLTLMTVVYFIQALTLRKLAAQAPIVVIVPLFILLMFRLIYFFKMRKVSSCTDDDDEAKSKTKPNLKVFSMIVWLFSFIIGIYLFGQYISIFLFLLLFFRISSKKSWVFSFAMSAFMLVFVYVLFSVVLSTDLYEGQLFMY